MPDADELEGARRLASLALNELSRYGPSSSSSPPDADLPPLLSCCFMLLPLLDHADPDLADRCVRRLRAFLRGILSRYPDPSFVPALEVFVKNVVFSSQLRNWFTMDDGAILKGSRVSTMVNSCQYELRVMLELMCYYFISLVRDEGAFEQFVRTLSWSEKAKQRTPELGLPGAILLVRRSYMFSMPVVAQAYFVLHTSSCVGNGDLNLHLGVFEHAMNAYLIHLPALGVFDQSKAMKSPFNYFAKKRPLRACIPDATEHNLSSHINGLLSFCKLHSDDGLHINEKDNLHIPVSFIQENQHIFPDQFRQEGIVVVNEIVSNILGCAQHKETCEMDVNVSEEIIFIAAVLRLMSSSLLQIFHFIRKMRVADEMQNENHIMLCISETISLLREFEANGFNGHDLFGVIANPVGRERASVLMLSHFASLLLSCLTMRLGFMWKSCIIMMMLTVRLVIEEDENLGLFRFLVTSKDSAISPIDQNSNSKGSLRRKYSSVVALNFNKLRKLHIGDEFEHDFRGNKSTLQRCNYTDGRAFFACMKGYTQNSSEWDDIVDFVECNEGTDYSDWLMRHRKFKEFKNEKRIRWKHSKKEKEQKKHVMTRIKRPRTSSRCLE